MLRRARPSARARRALLSAAVLVPAGPLLLLAGGFVTYARLPKAQLGFLALIVLAILAASAQGLAAARALGRGWQRASQRGGDDRPFLLDLAGWMRGVSSIEQLYAQVAEHVAGEFGVDGVSVFIRDDESGNFVCRVALRGRARPEGDATAAVRLTLADDSLVIRRLRHLDSPLGVDAGSLDLWVKGAPQGAREARAMEVAVLRAVGARLLVQIKTRGRLTGVLSLGPREPAEEFSPEEKLMLRSVAGQLALVLENSRLLGRMVEEERLRRELALAAEVQRRLFPEGPSSSPFVELAGYCQPARMVGGDYYDFLAFQNGQVGLAVADVAGKGMAAALLMSTLQASLRAQVAACAPDVSADGTLAALVSNLNLLLCNATGPASYVTFFYAQFDPTARRLVYVNAGHNPPIFLRAGHPDDFQSLSSGGTVVGLFEHCAYEQEAVQMGAGDVLLAYTDGLSEALDVKGEEFGEARVRRALAESAWMTVEGIRDEIVLRVQEWCRDAPQHDDLTFIVVKVR